MRRLTADELKLVLERGIDPELGLYTDELRSLSHGEAVEALALEVSERRVAEATTTQDSGHPLRDLPSPLWAALWTGINNYARACGGDTSAATARCAARLDAVTEVERAVEACMLRSLYDRAPANVALLRGALAALRDLTQEANGVEHTGRVTTFWPAVRFAESVLKRAAGAGIGEG